MMNPWTIKNVFGKSGMNMGISIFSADTDFLPVKEIDLMAYKRG